MAGKGGGAWKVAYADFVTAMMAFFMVMWITSQDQKIKEAIAHHFSDPFGANDRNGKSGGLDASGPPFNMNDNKRLAIKPRIVRETLDRRFQLGTAAFFPENSAELNDAAVSALELLLPTLRWEAAQIEIVGFTDKQAVTAGESSPWILANQRCLVVKDYLEAKGIMVDKIRLSQGVSGPLLDPKMVESQMPADFRYENRVEVRVPPTPTE
jgi:chemotaxis protein MotB